MRVPYAKAVSVALVINELVSNSIKHNQRLGRPLAVSIRVTQDDAAGQIVILYRGNGRGFPAQHPAPRRTAARAAGFSRPWWSTNSAAR